MIGAILAKKKTASSFDAFNSRDLTKMMATFSEDATYTFPGSISISGETKGKKAIEAVYTKMMEHYPKMHFTVKDIFVSNVLAMGATNNIAVEYDLSYTNREGKELHNSGVSIIRVKGGKAVAVKEYVFNTDISKEGWGEG
jgi:ketosteroid isomerase-like protein